MTAGLTMIYGGSGSGKSFLAESLLERAPGPRLYVATMDPAGRDARERIRRHRAARRDKGFITVERLTAVADTPYPAYSALLLECLGTWLANEMFAPGGAGDRAGEAVARGLTALRDRTAPTIVVTNDVFADGVSYTPETERYRTILAALNQRLALLADTVVETVCGIALVHKGSGAPPCDR